MTSRRSTRPSRLGLASLPLLAGALTVLLLVFGAVAASPAPTKQAYILYNCNAPTGPLPNLQAAINAEGAATANPTNGFLSIRGVCKGNFVIGQSHPGQIITLAGVTRFSFYPILQGTGNGPTLSVINGATVTVQGFGITNGNQDGGQITGGGPKGGGIYVGCGSRLTVYNSVVKGNHNQLHPPNILANGGGILNWGGAVTVTSSLVTNNSVYKIGSGGGQGGASGGGIANVDHKGACHGSLANYQAATTTVDGSTVAANSAGYGGGGIFSSGLSMALVTLCQSHVTGNMAKHGGGIEVEGQARAFLLCSTTVSGNTAVVAGGGITCKSVGSFVVPSTPPQVVSNTAGTAPNNELCPP